MTSSSASPSPISRPKFKPRRPIDSSRCTPDTWQSGTCAAGAAIDCSGFDTACQTASCDAGTGSQYYETIAGGSGATRDAHGASAVQVHMTRTRITDPEVLEVRLPWVRLLSLGGWWNTTG